MSEQSNWRYCRKCFTLFFNGSPNKGKCAGGGSHETGGTVHDEHNYVIPYNAPVTPTAQQGWDFCVKCFEMFYNGNADKGKCAGGGGHQAMGYNFVIPYNIPGTPYDPTKKSDPWWALCVKCFGMFFDGSPGGFKGKCVAGGGHQKDPNAYGYALTFKDPSIHLEDRGRYILVSGNGFSPNNQIQIFYSYQVLNYNYVYNNNGAPLVATTRSDGSFEGVTMALPSNNVFRIMVTVVDDFTNLKAFGTLRLPYRSY